MLHIGWSHGDNVCSIFCAGCGFCDFVSTRLKRWYCVSEMRRPLWWLGLDTMRRSQALPLCWNQHRAWIDGAEQESNPFALWADCLYRSTSSRQSHKTLTNNQKCIDRVLMSTQPAVGRVLNQWLACCTCSLLVVTEVCHLELLWQIDEPSLFDS